MYVITSGGFHPPRQLPIKWLEKMTTSYVLE